MDRFKARFWNETKGFYQENLLVCSYTGGLLWQDGTDYDDKSVIKVEQCTGLKDKQGNLLYDGDIVIYKDELCQIGQCDISASFYVMTPNFTDYGKDISKFELDKINCELIGNMNQDPELLEQ